MSQKVYFLQARCTHPMHANLSCRHASLDPVHYVSSADSTPLIFHAKSMPMTQQTEVTQPVSCQPPYRAATQATSGGPANWPSADHCCIQPTVVDTVSVLGASLIDRLKSVAGIKPPSVENTNTPAYCAAGNAVAPKASKAPAAIATNPVANSVNGGVPRPSKRPASKLPKILTAAAPAVSQAVTAPGKPACA